MLDLNQFRQDVKVLIRALSIEADEAEPERQVEIGMFLWNMIDAANTSLDTIKDRYLRPYAMEQANKKPGPQVIYGLSDTECIINIPEPSYRLKKDVDMDHIRDLLGDRFSEFFQESSNVQPRRETGNLVARMNDGEARQALLDALEEHSGTPRVMFKTS